MGIILSNNSSEMTHPLKSVQYHDIFSNEPCQCEVLRSNLLGSTKKRMEEADSPAVMVVQKYLV